MSLHSMNVFRGKKLQIQVFLMSFLNFNFNMQIRFTLP